jgi:lincosamide nucleotidyltransferase A/C/D/E
LQKRKKYPWYVILAPDLIRGKIWAVYGFIKTRATFKGGIMSNSTAMNERDVVNLLKLIEDIGVSIWIDGGWGVDALIGLQTRAHNDIDVLIEKKNADVFVKMLISKGYSEIEMDYTSECHTVWKNSSDHVIDLHLFEFGEAEILYYDNEAYPSNILNGEGTIGGVAVQCLTAEAQLLYHQGYEYKEKDIHDVLLLCETFAFDIPVEYKKYQRGSSPK